MDLTTKQSLFVGYYLGVSKGNATDAARRAGYSDPSIGRQLITKDNVRAAIDAKLDGVAMSSDEILARLSEVARGPAQHFVDVSDRGSLVANFKKAKRRGKLWTLKKFKHTEDGVQFETHDPVRALELLGKFRKLWVDRVEVAGNRVGTDVVEEAGRRRKEREARLAAEGQQPCA